MDKFASNASPKPSVRSLYGLSDKLICKAGIPKLWLYSNRGGKAEGLPVHESE